MIRRHKFNIKPATMKKNYLLRFVLLIIIKVLIYSSLIYLSYKVLFDLTPFNGHRLTSFGFKNEVLLVLNIGLIYFFISKRFYFSTLLTVLTYFIFIYVSFEKIKYFNTPLLPSDFKYVDQVILVWPIFKTYIPVFSFFLLLLLVLFLSLKIEKPNAFLKNNPFAVNIIVFCTVLLISIFSSKLYNSLKNVLASTDRGRSHLVSSSEINGLLVTFVRNILHSNNDLMPQDYSFEKIKSIHAKIDEYDSFQLIKKDDNDVNLIIYLVESFTDPLDAGINTTLDPIPFFHKLQKEYDSGFVYSPEIGGRSANVEFELLTGFSMQFFSKSTIPFIDLPQREIPSLAREMKLKKYYTKVIQAANLGFFNYKQMYNRLGFEDVISLSGKKNVPLDIVGRSPSDEAIVNEIIKTSKINEKYFIYAFPNSTHGSWKYHEYDDSLIDLKLDYPLNDSKGEQQLRTYLNALNTADLAIKKLIKHFEKEKTKTAILILGDHQPGLPEFREQYMLRNFPNKFTFKSRRQLRAHFFKFDKQNPILSYKIMHRIPYVLWTNYETEKPINYNMGMNSLILKLFDTANINPHSDFYSFLKEYSKNVTMESLLKYVFNGEEDVSLVDREWNDEFKNIQYDLLIGEEYLLDN